MNTGRHTDNRTGRNLMKRDSNRLIKVIDNILISFVLSFLVVSSVLFFKPLSIILGNPSFFISPPGELAIYYLSGMSIYLIILFVFSLLIMSIDKLKPSYVALLFSVCILFYIQGNALNWDYGVLDGRDIPWNTFWYRELLDLTVWSSTLIFAFIKRQSLLQHFKIYALILILIQTIPVGFQLINDINSENRSSISETEHYSIDESKKFVFSENKNVLVFVLDTIGDYAFADVLSENSEFIKEFDGFTRFDNMLGTGGYTNFSVPAFFSGTPYLNHIPYNDYSVKAFKSDGSLLKTMRDKGWHTGFYSSSYRSFRKENISPTILTEIKFDGKAIKFIDPDLQTLSLYESSPQSFKRWFYEIFELDTFWEERRHNLSVAEKTNTLKTKLAPLPNNSSDLHFVNKMLFTADVSYVEPSFKYYHLNGAHVPYLLDKEFKENRSNYEDSIYVSLMVAIRFIHILKELGIYDSTQIYIMADHGSYPSSSDKKDMKEIIKDHYTKKATSMFMFKDFSTRGDLHINSTPLSYFDFPSIVGGLVDKDPSDNIQSVLQHFAKHDRKFYSFANNMVDAYFPRILELHVTGNISDSQAWSLTGREFMPSTMNTKREFNCNNDMLPLDNPNEYLHYVSDNLTSGLTKGHDIKFSLPLRKDCIDNDILIRIGIAAILGTDIRTGEKVESRSFQLSSHDDNFNSGVQHINTEEFVDFSFLIDRKFVRKGLIEFTLMINDVIPNGQFRDRKGNIDWWGTTLRLNYLSISQPIDGKKYIQLAQSKVYGDFKQRVDDVNNIKSALENFHNKYSHYPRSVGMDGLYTNWGKSTPNYIIGLVPEFLESLPIDPRQLEDGSKNYLYTSNGSDFKFIVHSAPEFDKRNVEISMIDPRRPSKAYGIWSEGAEKW